MRYTDLPKNNTHFKVRLRACLAVVIVLCTGTNYALDLVKPITIPTESLLAAQDAQSVLKNIYFARHHRIVRLDPEVLMQESEFKVSLFDGEEIRLRTSSITPTGIHVEWKGELVDQYTDLPPAIIDPESGEQITGKEAEALWQAARELQLRVVSWDVDQDTGLIAPQGQRVLADAPTIRPSLRRNVYTTIEGSLKLHSLGKTIVFKNIPEHPDLQLMYEVNEQLNIGRLSCPTCPKHEAAEDSQRLAEIQKYDDYLESIGIDRGNLKTEKQRAEELHTWLRSHEVQRLPADHYGYELLQSNGFDPENIEPH